MLVHGYEFLGTRVVFYPPCHNCMHTLLAALGAMTTMAVTRSSTCLVWEMGLEMHSRSKKGAMKIHALLASTCTYYEYKVVKRMLSGDLSPFDHFFHRDFVAIR